MAPSQQSKQRKAYFLNIIQDYTSFPNLLRVPKSKPRTGEDWYMVLCACRKIQDGAWLCSDKNGHLCAVSTKPGPDRKRLLDQVQEDDTLFVKNVSASPIPGGMPGNSQIPMWTIILNRFEDVEIVRAPLHTIFEVDDELRRRYEEDGMRQCALCLEHCSQRCSVCKLPYCSSACQLDDWEMSHEKECSAYKILTEINNSPFGQLAETREWDSEEEEDEDGCPCGHCY